LHITRVALSLQEKKAKSLDELDPSELITKCKNLLMIAKKAKASKDGKKDKIINVYDIENKFHHF
jgi:hypothetical protein